VSYSSIWSGCYGEVSYQKIGVIYVWSCVSEKLVLTDVVIQVKF